MSEVHFQHKKTDYPICEIGALVHYITKEWSHVTCEDCRKMNMHRWGNHGEMVTCKVCGLIKGSGYKICDGNKP